MSEHDELIREKDRNWKIEKKFIEWSRLKSEMVRISLHFRNNLYDLKKQFLTKQFTFEEELLKWKWMIHLAWILNEHIIFLPINKSSIKITRELQKWFWKLKVFKNENNWME